MYCNNFNDVFSSRSHTKSINRYTPDDYLAGLFCLLKPGARLICLEALKQLPPPLEQMNEIRASRNLSKHPNASFYDMEIRKDEGGDSSFTFTSAPFTVYIYTRKGDATFLCSNPKCDGANNATPIKAWTETKEGNAIVVDHCDRCDCKLRASRRRTTMIHKDKSTEDGGGGGGGDSDGDANWEMPAARTSRKAPAKLKRKRASKSRK